jgi:hypothetical protein
MREPKEAWNYLDVRIETDSQRHEMLRPAVQDDNNNDN